jgi:phage shock protein A
MIVGMVVPNEDNTPYVKRLKRQIESWRMRAQMAKQLSANDKDGRMSKLEEEALKRLNDCQKELDRVLNLDDQ